MPQRCRYRYCDRLLEGLDNKLSPNKIYTNFCSLYCHEAMLAGIRPITNNKPVVPCKTYRQIDRCCTVCKTKYKLSYGRRTAKSHQRFCSHACYHNLIRHKKGHRDYFILTLLKEKGTMTAGELAKASSGFKPKATLRSISLILKVWRARGIVSAERTSEKKPYRYTFISDLLPGELILKYCRS